MKVAVVTWITYNNYGTELQAFALQKYLLSLGMESFIISDQDIVYNARKRYEKRIFWKSMEHSSKRKYKMEKRIPRYECISWLCSIEI